MNNSINELNLKNHYEIMEVLFNMMPYVFWKDRQGIYCGANANLLKTFDFASEDFIGKTIFEILEDQESARRIDEVDYKIMQDGSSVIIEESILTSYGEKVYLSQKSSLFDKSGKVIGLLGFSMDITQIKEEQNQITLEKEQLALENQEHQILSGQQKKFQTFIEQLSYMINGYKISSLNDKLGKCESNPLMNNIELTKREKEVLYYLSLNRSPKEIAAILSILDQKNVTPKTIQSIIDKQLYFKFKVYSIGQLIEQANSRKLIPFLLDK